VTQIKSHGDLGQAEVRDEVEGLDSEFIDEWMDSEYVLEADLTEFTGILVVRSVNSQGHHQGF
jgi:hypothetical protein